MDEAQLRLKVCNWVRENFPKRKYYIKPMLFHDSRLTVSDFLKKNFKGTELVQIPQYDEMHIRPDIIALLILNNQQKKGLGWVVGECKVSSISSEDLRQAVFYANTSKAYEAYLFLTGTLSSEVEKIIESGGHSYLGTNKWGREVRKRVHLRVYENGRFAKTIY